MCTGNTGGEQSKYTSRRLVRKKWGKVRKKAECERASSLLGWDWFYLINCYRNIYPVCDSSTSHDVFMCSKCLHTHSDEGRGQARSSVPGGEV